MPSAITRLERTAEDTLPVEEQSSRASVYSLLGALLARPPDAEALRTLAALRGADTGGQALAGAWSALEAAADAANEQTIVQEYNDLFIGVGRGELVPYGSYYMAGFLNEKPLAALRLDLERLGFERQDGVRESEDHAAALCETMSLLIGDEDTDFEEQQRFFGVHMAPWMPKLFRDLRTAKSALFYAAVGELGERFMEFETTYFAMLV